MMIDTHAHLEDYNNLEEIIERMKNNIIIISGVNQRTNDFVLKTCEKYENVFGTIGIHPEEVDTVKNEDFLYIEKNLSHPKIVGIGEIGLDYHYGKENQEKQREVFIKQIELAKKYHKTVVIHSRDALEDTYNIIEKLYTPTLKLILHCYSGSKEMADRFKKFAIKFGIGGVITFKNGVKLKEVVKHLDIEDLLLETDSPYLTPEPYRGKKNEPYNILFVAQKIAEVKEISLEKVLSMTTKNAIHQFDLPIKI